MDANELLEELRALVRLREPIDVPNNSMSYVFARAFRDLDAHLSGGGRPPTAWAEGPDAPELDECTHDTVVMGRCDDCGAYPHGHYGREPLGGPVPGVDGSRLPELSDNYGHRVNPL